jgi:hypothetical protein
MPQGLKLHKPAALDIPIARRSSCKRRPLSASTALKSPYRERMNGLSFPSLVDRGGKVARAFDLRCRLSRKFRAAENRTWSRSCRREWRAELDTDDASPVRNKPRRDCRLRRYLRRLHSTLPPNQALSRSLPDSRMPGALIFGASRLWIPEIVSARPGMPGLGFIVT